MIRNEEGASLCLVRRDPIETTPETDYTNICFGIKETDLRLDQYLFWNQGEGSGLSKYLFRNPVDMGRIRKHVFQEVNLENPQS